ncbi:hypothetical protein B0A49_03514 [Cryomyces minteri]|uniref:Uncharacterized protein n=1 Tax=Cryomyces minteri TaxID=331657 RepID=A0A4U0XL63_9PEZI|nr:hypothetical protein B0A49_03514 [Cryomyces minteri]
MEHRGHREVSVQVSGVQRGLERFPFGQGHEDESPPVMGRWRCNLTGLSQVHNLYFVAYSHEIWVYQPQFPTQELPKEPSFVFKLPLSTPGLPGYIDPQNPHGINNLVIGFLGNEEIIAVVCDDGDVIAHYTQDFNDAVERRQTPDSLDAPPDDLSPVFFHANVGMSAWGLAIHTEARMIAVSGPGVSNLDDEERTWKYWDISDSRTEVKDSSVWYGNAGRPLSDDHEESLYDNEDEGEDEDEDEEEDEEEESVMGGYPGAVGDIHERPEDFRSRVLFLDDDRVCDNTRRPIRPVPKLACPLLFASVADIYLLQPWSNPDEPASCSPIVALADSLYQKPSEHTSRCNVFDRFNLSAQIPDLGVIVLASQKGRVAVLALTQVQTQVSEPTGDSFVRKVERTVFAYRLDRILPFHSQEKAGQRPNAPLLGIAVGPIQGTAGEGRTRRWRLMLHYLDYTVLSYEIGKGRDDVLGVQNLIV